MGTTHPLLALDPESLPALTPEASARRYFRAGEGWLLVLSDAPPPQASTDWLTGLEVQVPALGESTQIQDNGHAWRYLVKDCGDVHLADRPHLSAWQSLLESCERWIFAPLPEGHPQTRFALDSALFRRELEMFASFWRQDLRQQSVFAQDQDLCQRLAQAAAAGPQGTQHRDLHSRNVLLDEENQPILLDHQDLRPGPLFYDLASLATDAYVDFPKGVPSLLEATALSWGKRCLLSAEQTQEYLCLGAMQRVLKALGTFGRLLGEGRRAWQSAEIRARDHALALTLQAPSGWERDFARIREWLA